MADPEEPLPEADHYYTARPRSASRPRELRFLYRGKILHFQVDQGVFASHGLDPGTALLIESFTPGESDRILDLGCGWGPIGIAAARAAPKGHVVMTDVNHRAVQLARRNLRKNDIENAEVRSGAMFVPVGDERFDLVVCNPPYHVGREAILRLLEEAPKHLNEGGALIVVGKGSQGILFYQEWLAEHWPGSVEVLSRRSGYRVLCARLQPPSRNA